jgi:hypothetical protein
MVFCIVPPDMVSDYISGLCPAKQGTPFLRLVHPQGRYVTSSGRVMMRIVFTTGDLQFKMGSKLWGNWYFSHS